VLVHALPALTAQREALTSYLGWTAEMQGPQSLRPSLEAFWGRLAFERQVGVFLVLGGSLGTLFVGMQTRGAIAPLAFALCYLAALAAHLVIKDRAYHPRHYVLIAHAAAYLSLYCGTRLVIDLSRKMPRRSSP
jgi:hypothetical protein